MSSEDAVAGSIVWVSLDPVRGREQGGHRPALVVSSPGHLALATTLAIVLPITTTDRGWPNHVRVVGGTLGRPSWVMTEQPRTLARDRITGIEGTVSASCLRDVRVWLGDFLDL